MKYVVMQSVGGNTIIKSEWSDKNKAKQAFHDTCRLLYADEQTTKATVTILDENSDIVDGKREFIDKTK